MDILNELNKTSLTSEVKLQIVDYIEKLEKKANKKIEISSTIACPKLKKSEKDYIMLDKTGNWFTDGAYMIKKAYVDSIKNNVEEKQYYFNAEQVLPSSNYTNLDMTKFEISKKSSKLIALTFTSIDDYKVSINRKFYDHLIKPLSLKYDIELRTHGKNKPISIYDKSNKTTVCLIMPLQEVA